MSLWPSWAATQPIASPASKANVAKECRHGYCVRRRSPARFDAGNQTRLARLSRSSGPPVSLGKTNSDFNKLDARWALRAATTLGRKSMTRSLPGVLVPWVPSSFVTAWQMFEQPLHLGVIGQAVEQPLDLLERQGVDLRPRLPLAPDLNDRVVVQPLVADRPLDDPAEHAPRLVAAHPAQLLGLSVLDPSCPPD
jgi:hypothetical protein